MKSNGGEGEAAKGDGEAQTTKTIIVPQASDYLASDAQEGE